MYFAFGSLLPKKKSFRRCFPSNFSSGGCFVLLSGTVCAVLLEGIMRKMCSISLGQTSRPGAVNVKMTVKTEYDQEIHNHTLHTNPRHQVTEH